MKTYSAFLCSFLLAASSDAEPPGKARTAAPLTLSAATQMALANNRSIRESLARWKSMKARVPQAAAWDDLKISATTRLGRFVNIAPNGFTDQMFSVEQMIPISGRNQSRARIAAAEALGGLEEFRRREIDVVMKVRLAYVRLSNSYAQLDFNRAADASLTQTRDITRSKFEVGAQSQAEALAAEAESIRISEARHDLERNISDAETQLKVLMNLDAFAVLGCPADDLSKHASVDPDGLRALLLSNRPELRMAQAKVAAARAGVELAKREWIPDPTLSVQAQRYNDASQAVSEVSAGISFSVPWLNGKKYRANEREAQAQLEAAQDALEASQTEAIGMLRDQLRKIDTFHHHVELFRDRLLPNARQAMETARTGYEGDKTSFLDLTASQRSLWETESMARQHLADYQASLAELEAIVGADLQLFGHGPGNLEREIQMTRRDFIRKLSLPVITAGPAWVVAGCNRIGAARKDPNVAYYTCTMHPSVRSQNPNGKCPICSMDLVPVMKKGAIAKPEDHPELKPSEFTVLVERQQQIGVTYAVAERKPLRRTIRAVGILRPDRSRQWSFVARVEGYVQKLFVTSPGESVEEGAPLLTIYSPALLTAEREFVNLLESRERSADGGRAGSERLLDASRRRLEQWNVTATQIAELEKSRSPTEFLTLASPFNGVVEGVPADQGRKVMIGDPLVTVADLSALWAWVEFYENELSLIASGQKVKLTAIAYPDEAFEGEIRLVDPFIDETARTSRARIDIRNADLKLRPGMQVNVELAVDGGVGLTIPLSAVMPTGSRALVFVDKGAGRLEPRFIQLGGKFRDVYEVRRGLVEGERVVASANFLIDAESKVQGAVKSFQEPPAADAAK